MAGITDEGKGCENKTIEIHVRVCGGDRLYREDERNIC